MSIPSNPIRWTALLFVVAALVTTGCGHDNTSAPQNVYQLDEVPPLAPSAVGVADQFTTKFVLDWDDNTEADLVGYRVYEYEPDPDRENAYVLVSGSNLVDTSSMTLSGVAGTTYIFRITAIDDSDNESAWSDALTYLFNPSGGTEDVDRGGAHDDVPEIHYPNGDDRDPTLPDDQIGDPDSK